MSHRFYVPTEMFCEDNTILFAEDQRRQLKNVLRLRAGDTVRVFDGTGKEFQVRIDALDSARASAGVLAVSYPNTEPLTRVTLVQGLPKGEKVEYILQKCTEIGVSEFIFTETARSVPKISPAKLESRLERWRCIVKEAAEQSGRVKLPSIRGILSFKEALESTCSLDRKLIAWEEEKEAQFTDELRAMGSTDTVAYFVGPEGGFTPQEVDLAGQAGVIPVSLGPRILRTETAAMVGSALLVYKICG